MFGPNGTQGSREDSSSVIRIVGGRNCHDGECPWQVTAEVQGLAPETT